MGRLGEALELLERRLCFTPLPGVQAGKTVGQRARLEPGTLTGPAKHLRLHRHTDHAAPLTSILSTTAAAMLCESLLQEPDRDRNVSIKLTIASNKPVSLAL
jgi:hypothetical protein